MYSLRVISSGAELILERIPYRIVVKELEIPAYRKIGLAMKDKESAPLAVKRFLDYLQYRIPEKPRAGYRERQKNKTLTK